MKIGSCSCSPRAFYRPHSHYYSHYLPDCVNILVTRELNALILACHERKRRRPRCPIKFLRKALTSQHEYPSFHIPLLLCLVYEKIRILPAFRYVLSQSSRFLALISTCSSKKNLTCCLKDVDHGSSISGLFRVRLRPACDNRRCHGLLPQRELDIFSHGSSRHLVLFYAAYQVSLNPENATLGFFVCAFLAIVMRLRFFKSGTFMPAGLVAGLSVAMGGRYLLKTL